MLQEDDGATETAEVTEAAIQKLAYKVAQLETQAAVNKSNLSELNSAHTAYEQSISTLKQ